VVRGLVVLVGGGAEDGALDVAEGNRAVDAEGEIGAFNLGRASAALEFERACTRGDADLDRLADGRARPEATDGVAGEEARAALELRDDDGEERLEVEVDSGGERVGTTLIGERGGDLGVAGEVDEEDRSLAAPGHHHFLELGDFGLLGADAGLAGFLLLAREEMGIVLDPAAVSKLGGEAVQD
jgi:hypothetical protein